ncbi:MAG: LysM peptidoglycan-binding domain-containing protein [Owenweeksia sp.]|nr:LysM peptidoglycan-binding domain-containing protein [Owenweeksia sp.]
MYKDDDRRNECFRAYKHAEESYRDHSLFLKNRSRYAELFEEDPTDYKAWAKGLKKAGYATNRKYDNLLIDLIERYELHRYDDGQYEPAPETVAENQVEEELAYGIKVSANYVKYVIAEKGDGWVEIAEVTNKNVSELVRYNEVDVTTAVQPGQRVYLQPKRNKASLENEEYRVQEGDTMYSIAQKFGIKLKKVYKRNDLKKGEQPKAGQLLDLR